MQKNRLWHAVSTQKTINQSDHPSLRYKRKRDSLVWAKPTLLVLAVQPVLSPENNTAHTIQADGQENQDRGIVEHSESLCLWQI